jgi:hypothetical protein
MVPGARNKEVQPERILPALMTKAGYGKAIPSDPVKAAAKDASQPRR